MRVGNDWDRGANAAAANRGDRPSGRLLTATKTGPWRHRVDAKLDRSFALGGFEMTAYVWVLNLFDRKNPISVYTSSGSSDETGWLSQTSGRRSFSTAEARTLYDLAQTNPNNYDCPRMFRFGLKTSF